MSPIEADHSPIRRYDLLRFTLAVLLLLISGLVFAAGTLASRVGRGRATAVSTTTMQAPSTPTPASLSPASPQPSSNILAQSIEVTSGQNYINFDDVPSGTAITNQYPPAVFSTSFGWYLVAHNQFYDGVFDNYGSSPPNILDHAPIVFPHAYAPLYVDFTQPVNALKFYVVAVDDFRPNVAQINIYQNHSSTPSATRNIAGFGYFYIPVPVDVGGWGYNNVTRIEIVNITDTQGIGYDDFTFSLATPTPTPTPTPSPSPTPFAPMNLHGEGHIEEITLAWGLQANTTGYNVKRRASFEPSWTTIATGVQPTTFTSFGNTQLIGRYRDLSATPDINYSYAVTASNANGESPFSNIFSAMLEPSCGNFQPAEGPVQQTYPDPGNGWSLTANTNGADGLVMSDVRLKNRYMAKMISVPYFILKTNKMGNPQRGELTAISDATTMRARLLRYSTPYSVLSSDGHVAQQHYVAEYAVDRLTPTSKSCLLITQDYVFNESNQVGDKCEPSASVPCARFYPKVSYKFKGRGGETLESLNVAQRLHYRVDGFPQNSIGVFRDSELLPTFADKANPAVVEGAYNVIKNGRDAGSWDNIHQTQFDKVDEPPADPLHGVFGGCPDCVHTHWRWGGFFAGPPYYYRIAGYELIGNNPSFFVPTNQDVDIGLVRYRLGEEHPTDFRSLTNNNESLKDLVISGSGTRSRTQIKPADVLYWYSATSYEPEEDLFFKHGSWFNPEFQRDVNVPNAAAQTSSAQATEDGVRSITYGHTYKDGATAFTNIDPNTLAPLPVGYAPLDNRAYKISTDAIVSGPNVVYFDVPSISDQTVFNNLAIFHLETDPFDPDNSVWVDDTILSPDAPAPDFANHVLSARVNDVGYFAIGVITQPQPDPGNSDLSIAVNHSASTVTVEDNVSYTLHVGDAGPQPALGVGVVNTLPLETTFISASSPQGTCKYEEGAIYCKLGTIASGSSLDITIVAKTIEDKVGIQQQGRTITNTSVVAGSNTDTDLGNNSATDNITLVPNPNPRPNVTITSPVSGTSYPGPETTVNIAATTSGNISRVDFYDGSALIGTASGGGNQYQLSWNTSSGAHTIVALATGTNGRINTSDPVNVFVNGAATISITSPASNSVFDSNANLAMTANTSGLVSKVEFFANWISLGQASGGNPYSLTSNLQNGNYTVTAVATDPSGAITVSAPVTISVTSRPSVTIASPVDGMTYPVTSRVAIMAMAKDSEGFVSKVDFYANGSLIGTGSFIGQDRFSFEWTDTTPGIYSITALATNNLGVTTTSQPISIGIDSQSVQAGEFIWFDDALPTGAVTHTDDEGWYWVDANPGSFSGTKAHQSRNFAQLDLPNNSLHQHYFEGATTTLPVNAGDKLFTYVFLDVNSMPREIMLQWKDASGWEHRAYWGANRINWGVDGTNSRRFMGPLPKAGQWVRLEVPTNLVGLEGSTLNGMAFTLDAGRATFDLAGKATANAAPPPVTPPGDSVWIEDGLPAGSVTATVNDQWNWVTNPHYSGLGAHQSQVSVNHNSVVYRSHSFTGAQTPMQVNPGDVLFTYVYVDPSAPAQQIMLQWYDGTSWEHRALWSSIYLTSQFPNSGVWGTESQRYMGGLPPTGNWYRLEVPASYVGLEGKAVSGMAFSVYGLEPTIAWDRSGKAPASTTTSMSLSSTTGVWRLFSNSYGYAFEINELGTPDHFAQRQNSFYAYPNQAAGTVPIYRFRRPTNYEYFYSRCKECYVPPSWQYEGIAFYVYPDASTPGTVPLYLYHDSQFHYFLTVNQSEAAGMTFDAIWAFTYATNPVAPVNAAPVINLASPTNGTLFTAPATVSINASASDNDGSVSKVEFFQGSTKLGEVSAAPYSFDWNNVGFGSYVLTAVATDNLGAGAHSNPVSITVNAPPNVSITNPAAGTNFPANTPITINASASDSDGTIAKVEFFANGNKLGEVTNGPYAFTWSNASTGTYSVTASATDNLGATSSSGPVSITVGKSDQTITFDPISDKTYGDAPFSINAASSSGLPVSFTVISGTATLSANTLAITGAGSVSIRADQAGNGSFNPAQSVTRSFNVAKAAATIALSNLSQTYDGTPKTATATTNPAGLSGVAITYNGSTSAPTNAGNYSVVASLTNNNYTAGNATGTLAIAKASQTITFNALAGKTYEDAPFVVSGSSSSGLTVSFAIVSGPATISGNTVTITGVGTVSVRASQAGGANYNAAADVDRSFIVAKGAATITLSNLSQIYDGTPKPATAATNPAGLSGVAITYNGSATAPTNAGGYSVVASLTNDNYQATNATGTLTITMAAQTITFNALTDKTYGNSPFTVSASSSSGLSVSFSIVSGPATISGSTVTITAVGIVTIRASQAGNTDYNAAADVDRSFNVAKATATIMLSNLNQTYNASPKPATAATNPAGLSGVSITYNSSPTSPTNAGTYSVVASLTNNNYTAGNATGTLIISKATPNIAWNNPADIVYGTALSSTQLNATASFGGNGLAGTFAYTPGPGTVLNTGSNQTLSTAFTPTDVINFNNTTGSVSINVTTGMVWTNGYTYRRSITIDHTRVPNSDQSNFPLLISGTYSYLATVANGGNVQSANGYDIIFTSDSGCANKLAHEVETYNPSTGAVNYWVNVPTVSHTTDTVFYMCYGNSSITTDQSNKTAVWDANYKGVWHLPNGTNLTANDSTGNGNNGTVAGAMAASGQVDGAAGFDGTDDYVSVSNNSSLHPASAVTFSLWFKATNNVTSNQQLLRSVGWLEGTNGYSMFVAAVTSGKMGVAVNAGSVKILEFPVSTNTWYHAVGVYDGSNFYLYVNGSLQASAAVSGSISYTSGSFYLGSANASFSTPLAGLIDEARVSSVARSADWIMTEYNNQSDPSHFYSISGGTSTSYAYHRTISIDHTKVPNSDQTSFPLLISGTYSYLATVANGGNVQSANGYDIIFTSDSGCANKLAHEVETYNPSTGAVNYWVNVPTVSHTTDTVFYMCYGNFSITTDQSNKTAVWDTNFKGVWHLANAPSLTANDSTGNGNNGTIAGAIAASGQVDGAAGFDGTDDYVSVSNNSSLHPASAVTFSLWFKATNNVTSSQQLLRSVGWLEGTNGYSMFVAAVTSGKMGVAVNAGSVKILEFPVSTNTWYHAVGVYDGSNFYLYVNGSLQASAAVSGSISYTSGSFYLGSANASFSTPLAGLIDEARVSSVARSADWIMTEYNNQSDPSHFYSISAASGGGGN